jgi:uncharacterized protein HemX
VDADYPPFVHNDQGERSASIIQIDNGRTVAAVAICAAFAALGVGASAFAVYLAQQSAMEQRVTQEKYNQMNPRVTQLEAKVYANP